MKFKCETCMYFENEHYEKKHGKGECRCNSPVLLKSNKLNDYLGI